MRSKISSSNLTFSVPPQLSELEVKQKRKIFVGGFYPLSLFCSSCMCSSSILCTPLTSKKYKFNKQIKQNIPSIKRKDNGEGTIEDIFLAIGIQNARYTTDIYPFARITLKRVTRKLLQDGLFIDEQQAISLQECKVEQFDFLGDQAQYFFDLYLMDEKLCPIPQQSLSVRNFFQNQEFQFIYASLDRCTTQVGCSVDAQQAFKQSQPTYLQSFKSFQMDIYLLDVGFNMGKLEPAFKKLHLFKGTFTTNLGSQIVIQLSQYSIQTDFSILPVQALVTEKGYYAKKFTTTVFESRNPHPYALFMLVFSGEERVVERQVGKVDELLSYAGGLFQIILVFLGFFMLSYNQYRYEIMVAEGAFNYNDDGKKMKESDFTFLKYVKYCTFDWIQVFCCCTLDWEDCKEIEGTRQGAINQLQISLLFKKIQILERAVQYLISEKEQICLYLTEPPSIHELHRKKRLAEYYDKVVQGQPAKTCEDIKIQDDVEKIFHLGLHKAHIPNTIKSNKRLAETADFTRENIVDYALDHHLSEEEKEQTIEQFDEEDEALQKQIAEAFFQLKMEKRGRIQEKIPLKILNRLRNRMNEINASRNVQISLE